MDHEYFLPLLGLYTGARLEEIGQSLVKDIKQERGVHYLDINGDGPGKQLKTRSSWRKVPLHPKLVELGFLDYVQDLRERGQERLFPKLRRGSKGQWTSSFSKRFGRILDQVGIADSRKGFHSFRHTFKEACRRAVVAEEVHDALTGHSGGGVGRTYGAVPLEAMAEAIEKVEYDIGF